MSNENEGDNKFGWDLRGKKKIAFLEGQLKKTQEDLDAEKEETSWPYIPWAESRDVVWARDILRCV